jgi:hypothetical protein
MTRDRAQHFFNKYKTFITVWQTSANVHEVRDILTEKGWTRNMETCWDPEPLELQDVKSYAYRLRKKGINLKDLYEAEEYGDGYVVDYEALKHLADAVASLELPNE